MYPLGDLNSSGVQNVSVSRPNGSVSTTQKLLRTDCGAGLRAYLALCTHEASLVAAAAAFAALPAGLEPLPYGRGEWTHKGRGVAILAFGTLLHPALAALIAAGAGHESGPDWACGTPRVIAALRALVEMRQMIEAAP